MWYSYGHRTFLLYFWQSGSFCQQREWLTGSAGVCFRCRRLNTALKSVPTQCETRVEAAYTSLIVVPPAISCHIGGISNNIASQAGVCVCVHARTHARFSVVGVTQLLHRVCEEQKKAKSSGSWLLRIYSFLLCFFSALFSIRRGEMKSSVKRLFI